MLAAWAASSPARFAWVSLDQIDNDPLQFWRCVVAALAMVEPALAAPAVPRLSAPVVSVVDEVLPTLVNR